MRKKSKSRISKVTRRKSAPPARRKKKVAVKRRTPLRKKPARSRKKKVVVVKRRTPPRKKPAPKPKRHKIRLDPDTKFWARKSKVKVARSRKRLRKPRTGEEFEIKKVMRKMPRALVAGDRARKKIAGEMSEYIGMGRRPRSVPVDVYVKIRLRDRETGGYRWISAPRQPVVDREEMQGILSLLMMYVQEYEEDFVIDGYEIEETVDE